MSMYFLKATSFIKSPMSGRHHVPDVPLGEHHGGSFRVYMKHKNEKLREQFNSGQGSGASRLFEGLVFHIDGWTEPAHDELRRIIHLHGGQLDQYLTSRVTHIIANHLPAAKIKLYREQKLARGAYQQTPVVKPTFLLESIERGRLLPHAPYLIDGLRGRHGASMTSFLRASPGPSDAAPMEEDDGRAAEMEGVEAAAAAPPRGLATPEPSPPPLQPPSPSKSAGRGGAQGMAEELGLAEDEGSSEEEEGGEGMVVVQEAERQRALVPQQQQSSGQKRPRPRTTKEDPDFISNFFRSSRLHFIGSFKGQLADLALQEMKKKREKRASGHDGGPWQPPSDPGQRVVVHVDMDCFFVSVLVRDRPDLQDKPVAVAHTNFAGTSEVSSCNYLARGHGVSAGMFMAEAKRLCPALAVLHYDFEQYEEASLRQIYPIFYEEADLVQPVSVDEAYLEFRPGTDGEAAAARIRQRIFEATRCPASAGVSCNMLLARMATKRAKPNGLFVLRWEQAAAYLSPMPAADLPGVGWELTRRLKDKGIETCADLQRCSLTMLQSQFGDKTGRMLHNSCRGIDPRPLETDPVRKSVAADVNWGMRFSQDDQVFDFIPKLAHEVATRLDRARAKGRTVTLRVKKSTYGPNEPTKFLGCGPCENFSRSETLHQGATADPDVIAALAARLYRQLQKEKGLPPELVRGMGLQVTRLEVEGRAAGQQQEGGGAGVKAITSWLRTGGGGPRQGLSDGEDEGEEEDDEEGQRQQGGSSEQQGRKREHVPTAATGGGGGRASSASLSSSSSRSDGQGRAKASSSVQPAASSSPLQPPPVSLSQLDPDWLEALSALPPDARQEALQQALLLPPDEEGSRDAPMPPPSAPPPQDVQHRKGKQRMPSQQQQQGGGGGSGLKPHHSRQRQMRLEDHIRLKSFESRQAGFSPEGLRALPLGVRLSVAEHPEAYLRSSGDGGDLRQHLMAAEAPTPSSSAPATTSSSMPTPMVVTASTADEPQEAGGEEEGEEDGLFKEEDTAAVRTALLRWLPRVGAVPSTAHLQLLAVYLCELVDKGQGDRAVLLLKAVKRWADGQGGGEEEGRSWGRGVQAVEQAVRERVLQRERSFESQYQAYW